jgi:hypothetical protein
MADGEHRFPHCSLYNHQRCELQAVLCRSTTIFNSTTSVPSTYTWQSLAVNRFPAHTASVFGQRPGETSRRAGIALKKSVIARCLTAALGCGSGVTHLREMPLQLLLQVVGDSADVGRNRFIVGDDGISPQRTKLNLRIRRTSGLAQCFAMVQREIREDDPGATSGALVPIHYRRQRRGLTRRSFPVGSF